WKKRRTIGAATMPVDSFFAKGAHRERSFRVTGERLRRPVPATLALSFVASDSDQRLQHNPPNSPVEWRKIEVTELVRVPIASGVDRNSHEFPCLPLAGAGAETSAHPGTPDPPLTKGGK